MNDSVQSERPPDFPPVSEKLPPRERIAVQFAIAIFCLCSILSLGLATHWYLHTPSAIVITGTQAEVAAQLENLRTQKTIVLDEVSKIFDLFVGKAFLPIFATIIGYLLGKRSSQEGN